MLTTFGQLLANPCRHGYGMPGEAAATLHENGAIESPRMSKLGLEPSAYLYVSLVGRLDLSVCPSVFACLRLTISGFLCLHLSVYVSACLSLSLLPSVCRPACRSVGVSVYLR